ncbi:MAG: hypothetical protein Q4F80_08700, partial [bacterium]|nr:hypothetical protein [bacterium]
MSWASTFNSGAMSLGLSNSMNNIHLNQNISPAEIQAKINAHHGIVNQNMQTQNAQAQNPNNGANLYQYQNGQPQAQYDNQAVFQYQNGYQQNVPQYQ